MAELRRRLAELDLERRALEKQLQRLTEATIAAEPPLPEASRVNAASPVRDKIALFRRLFSGRMDVFPVRWDNAKTGRAGYAPACTNEWVKGVCGKPQVKCSECPNQAFMRVTDEVIENHLRGEGHGRSRRGGDFVVGIYPLLPDDTCRLLAVDFDGESWHCDARAYVETCRMYDVPAVLERSRSGEGGHVWIFFAEPVSAREARQLGAMLITETMERRPEIGFRSYDRFFPSQDTRPAGGLGNLIALPLQRRPRERGNSVFVDDDLRPYDDQWALLSSIRLVDSETLSTLVAPAESRGRILAVRMPVEDDAASEPWRQPPSRRLQPAPLTEPLPQTIDLVFANEIYVDRSELPPSMVTRLARLAAFQNPEFYRAQAMRLPTFGKPRVVSCAELHPRHVALPRGCLDEALELLRSHGIQPRFDDQRVGGTRLDVSFVGTLRPAQADAVEALARNETGVLAATTAFGKTVVATALIARRQCNTLILVHRRQLLDQWTERLRAFISVGPNDVGQIGGGRRKPTGRIDVALIQSLVRKSEVSDLVADYGHLIVDECHHLSAASFEQVARRARARYVLGLSATVARKDGHHPIIFMQCGPVRYRVDARSYAAQQSFAHHVILRETPFRLPADEPGGQPPAMPAIYALLAADDARNDLIFDDVLNALEAGRRPIVLTEGRDHLERLRSRFQRFVRHLVILRGGMGAAERRAAGEVMRDAQDEELLLLATGRYLGEGFDDPQLDTLFLTMPISWKGTLAQYVGRLNREHQGKSKVVVYDYVDRAVPLLARMAARRQSGYRSLGYSIQ